MMWINFLDILRKGTKLLMIKLDLVTDWNQKRQIKKLTQKVKNGEWSLKKFFEFVKNEYPFLYLNLENTQNYTDYRLQKNQKDLILKQILVRSLCGDTDHYHTCHSGAKYLNLDNEAKALYALYFGFSYRSQWASLAIQIFPKEAKNIDLKAVAQWTGWVWDEKNQTRLKDSNGNFVSNGIKNYEIIPVGKDCRWNKFKFYEFMESVKKYVGNESLYEKLRKVATKTNDRLQNYRNLDKELKDNIWGMGRLTTFLAIQQLYEFFDWEVDSYDWGVENIATWSCRTGCLASIIGLENKDEDEIIRLGKLSIKDLSNELQTNTLKMFNDFTIEILNFCNENLPFLTNVFEFESVICEITDKYLLKCREFSGWTSQELTLLTAETIAKWENYKGTELLPHIPDLKVLLVQHISKRPRWLVRSWLDKNWMKLLGHLGTSTLLDELLENEVDLRSLPVKYYGENKLPLTDEMVTSGVKNIEDILKDFQMNDDEVSQIEKDYDPRLFIRWKRDIDLENRYTKNLKQSEKDFIANLDDLESKGLLYHKRIEKVKFL